MVPNLTSIPEYILETPSTNTAIVYLVRHGMTAWNEPNEERLRGWSNISLNENGIQAAHKIAKFLLKHNVQNVYTSDLLRAVETANVISTALKIKPQTDFDLRPWDVGILAGEPISAVLDKLKHYMEQATNEPIKGGESWLDFSRRAKTAIHKYLIKASKNQQPIALITHERMFCVLDHIITNGKKPIRYDGIVAPGGIVRISMGDKIKVENIL